MQTTQYVQVRRSRQLEISFVATVVNYEYKFIWTLTQVLLKCATAFLALAVMDTVQLASRCGKIHHRNCRMAA